MRPAGEISMALLQAARDLAQSGHGATLVELASRACVSKDVAADRVKKLKSRGHLRQVGERRVDYRNRPVAEYAPVSDAVPECVQPMTGASVLHGHLQAWGR